LKIAALAASAALLGAVAITPASALPSTGTGHTAAKSDGITLVAKKKWSKKKYYKQRYRAGGRYRHAPRGWHRYSYRPGDWDARGCIVVGPVWFCP
jgi:hypothetical protein